MLNEITLGFLKRLVCGAEYFKTMLSSYTDSERLLIAMDLQEISNFLVDKRDVYHEIESSVSDYIVVLCLDFLNKIITQKSIEKIVCEYNWSERDQIAIALYDIQETVLENMEKFVDCAMLREDQNIENLCQNMH